VQDERQQHPVEAAVAERQRVRLPLDPLDVTATAPRALEERRSGVKADDPCTRRGGEGPGEAAGAAADKRHPEREVLG
jgi:hypothetical protein